MQTKHKYSPTAIAKVEPKELPVFGSGKTKMVAIGGVIILPAKPPKRGEVTIQEATQKELKELFERGYTKYIKKEVVKPKKE